MRQLTAPAAIVALLMVSALAHSDDDGGALKPLVVFNLQSPSSGENVADFGRQGDTLRVSGYNDIYLAKIRSITAATSDSRARDPIKVFGKAGYYLYDLDAWAMVSSGPIIGPLRSRSYSLFGSGFDHAALNPLTMRSEYLRGNASSDSGTPASSSYLGWRL
jgi:hypothetical protein